MHNVEAIPLKNLSVSPENLRVVSPDKKDDKQLISSIKEHGILKNLIVVPGKKKNGFEVIDGGRRLAALLLLAEEKAIQLNDVIPCAIYDRESATEISLSANLYSPMHPADVYAAYKKLADQGKTQKEIAQAFGHSTNDVKKLLKLGSVAPELIQHYRDEKLSQAAIMAFTVTDDHEKQLACYKHLGSRHVMPWEIRNFLTEKAIASTNNIAKFVGLNTYKKAGGTTTSDLFENTVYLNDAELLNRLAKEKLQKHAEKLLAEGTYSWAETSLSVGHDNKHFVELPVSYVNVPEELEEKIKAAQAEYDAIEAIDQDDWTEEHDDKLNALEQQLDALDEEKDSYLQVPEEYQAICGAVLTIDFEGKISVEGNLAKKDVYKKHIAEQAPGSAGEAEPIQPGEQEEPQLTAASEGESTALKSDLDVYYRMGVQAAVLQHPELAMDIFIYSLACEILDERYFRDELISFGLSQYGNEAVGVTMTSATHQLEQAHEKLKLHFLTIEDEGEAFDAFYQLTKKDKHAILHYCIATSLRVSLPENAGELQQHLLNKLMPFDITQYWNATRENYFSRVTKTSLLEIIKSVSPEGAEQHASKKKDALLDAIDQMAELQNFIPERMRTTPLD